MISPIAHIVVGVADMAPVRSLWLEHFGFEVVAASDQTDIALARYWGLPDDAVAEQLLVRTPAARAGWLHFVRFANPGEAVRKNASATDLCPKNLDLNCIDMPARCDELAAAGYKFRSAMHEYAIGDLQAREVQIPAHDDTNVVLIELENWPIRLSSRHYGGISSFVVTVPDTATEAAFYTGLFGHRELLHQRISGPEIEAVVGLPAGAALDVRLLGDPGEAYGRVELIAYEGADSSDLYARARAPARGILSGRFAVTDPYVTLQQAGKLGYAAADRGELQTLFGYCRVVEIISPAGFRVEAFKCLAGG